MILKNYEMIRQKNKTKNKHMQNRTNKNQKSALKIPNN